MTNEEAINKLKKHTCFDCDFCSDTLFDCEEKQCDLKDAVKVVIEAAEKQIPKEYVSCRDKTNITARCPSCNAPLKTGTGSSSKYRNNWCNKCGQKIDWEIHSLSKVDMKRLIALQEQEFQNFINRNIKSGK